MVTPAELRPPVLVVAPHPDDESIGCGGLIALLRRERAAVRVVMMTDGSGSHPNSASYPAARLAELRQAEAVEALRILGVPREAVGFWMLPDRYVPVPGAAGFAACVERARGELRVTRPGTLVIPANCDAHGDHRASWAIWRQASKGAADVRILEYVVWPSQDAPFEAGRRDFDVSGVLALKAAAVAAHRSQHGRVIEDDPGGFVLPGDLLARAGRSLEIFYEGCE